MPSRRQITLGRELDQRAKARAQELGISFAEYVRRLISADLGDERSRADIAELFGIGHSGGSDVARHEDDYLAEALEADL